jgi:hypothetical protein
VIGCAFSTDGLLSQVFGLSLGHPGNYVLLCDHPELCRMFHVSCMVHLTLNAAVHTRQDEPHLDNAMKSLAKIPTAINGTPNHGGFGGRCPGYQPQVYLYKCM